MPARTTPQRKSIDGRSIRWDEALARQAYANGLWVNTTLADVLRQCAQDSPQRVLLVDGQMRLDCQTLYQQAEALASNLLAHAPRGSVVSFMLPNWHEAAVIYLAATLAGMAVNPILPSLRDHELRFSLQDVDSRFVFIPAEFRRHDYAAMLERVTAQLAKPPQVVVLRGDPGSHRAYAELFRGASGPVEQQAPDPDAVRMIMYTSGTTGRPKGVLHSHNSIHALMQQLGEHWLIDPGDKFLVPSPIAHIGGSIYAFEAPLLLGATAVLMEQWNPNEALKLIKAEGCTHMAGATPFLEQILAAAEKAGTHLPGLKVFICGGASVPPSLIRKAQDYFEHSIVTRVYGSSEVPVTTVGAPKHDERDAAADTDGRAGLADIRLAVNGATNTNEGEICARGPQMLVGYLHPEDEIGAFDDEGFFRTGDLAHWVDNNYLVVTGRAKDIIIRQGENISPKEIEDILLDHPQIADIAIVGLPDPRTGERACAVIIPQQGACPDVASLRDYLGERGVAKFKIPEQVVLWDTLPRNDAGKVLKHKIRAALTEAAEPSETRPPPQPSPASGGGG